ncbi:unnamed protein product [Paramecium octaurelia]|uniref:Uncharacterized protein n=1 Tax=Paramecium octaurelia TaxID=43137 RepID=A0A8S1TPW9_PAROT|nr:unnamed protein product [Paramecium octaurelia]
MHPKNDISEIGTQVFAQYKKMYEDICQRLKSEKVAFFNELQIWKGKYNTLQKTFESLNQSKEKSDVKIKQDLNDPKTLNQIPKISGHQSLNLQPNAKQQYFQIQIQQLNEPIVKQKMIQDLNDNNENHSIDNKNLQIENIKYSDQLSQLRQTSQHKISINKCFNMNIRYRNEKGEKQLEKLTKENQVLNQTNDELRKSIQDYEKGQQQKKQIKKQSAVEVSQRFRKIRIATIGYILINCQINRRQKKRNESLQIKIQEYQIELSNLNQLQMAMMNNKILRE